MKIYKIIVCPVCGRQPGASHEHGHKGEAVEVVPLSEVREALLEDAVVDLVAKATHEAMRVAQPDTTIVPWDQLWEGRKKIRIGAAQAALEEAADAAFPSTDSEKG